MSEVIILHPFILKELPILRNFADFKHLSITAEQNQPGNIFSRKLLIWALGIIYPNLKYLFVFLSVIDEKN